MKITATSQIGFDSVSLLVDGKRWFPLMGEMHFSRYPRGKWEEELCKMKAGGIDIVSLYVIWIHHEEIHGEFDFSGDRCLKDFLETVKKCGLYSILRIGPWAHGEARNGGFPDWLLEDAKENGYEVRTDAPRYLEHVRKFYEKTYEQSKGFFIKDGGPVIGIQIENEYGHCGGKNGDEGEQHMKTLQAMAKEIGFIAPIYTATGWGGAVTGGMLPVMGGYCEAPWDQRFTEIEPSGNYIFTKERNDHNIGSDHGLGVGITFDMDKFPYLTAELGGGLQVTHHRRPIASGLDTAAMTMVKLGSGANLLGYYMYHGGTNPKGKLTTLQESTSTGYPNDLPEYSYDFNAPLREFGQMEDTYREIRLLSMFIHDFGNELCDMPYVPQPGNPLKPDNLSDLRTAVRCKELKAADDKLKTGYLFVNNYQRRYEMSRHENVELCAYDADGETILARFPARDIEDGDFFFFPFNLPVGDALVSADATPLCILHGDEGDTYVFYSDSEASFDVKGELGNNRIIVITRNEALHSAKVMIKGKEYLLISEAEPITKADGKISLLYTTDKTKKLCFRSYPEIDGGVGGFAVVTKYDKNEDLFRNSDVFTAYESERIFENSGKADFALANKTDEFDSYSLEVTGLDPKANEVYMFIDYVGDIGRFKLDGEIATDSFYTGQLWEIGLKRYCETQMKAQIEITPLFEEYKEKMYLQTWPEMKDGRACSLNGITLMTQYEVALT